MKTLYLRAVIFLLMSIPYLLFSQSDESALYADSQLTVEVVKGECRDEKNDIHKEYVFLSFTNNTSKTLTVSYKQHLWYNDECLTCDVQSEEYTYTVDLAPGQKLVPECRDRKNRAVAVFSKMINIDTRQLTNIELVDVVVSE